MFQYRSLHILAYFTFVSSIKIYICNINYCSFLLYNLVWKWPHIPLHTEIFPLYYNNTLFEPCLYKQFSVLKKLTLWMTKIASYSCEAEANYAESSRGHICYLASWVPIENGTPTTHQPTIIFRGQTSTSLMFPYSHI